jgi:hypothetical protein
MFSPVTTHPTCDLATQRRIAEARRDGVARSLRRNGRRRSVLDRVLGREPGERPREEILTEDLRPQHEDVWKSLRF